MVTVSRHAHFNAAHRLYNSSWDDAQNARVFGKCSNPFYHGHNYELIVSVTGPVDPQTGFVIDLKVLADLIADKIESRFDHKNLNEEVEEFRNLIPTAENICIVIYDILKAELQSDLKLKITLYETPRNFVAYSGGE
jgi:6-pyruvoyltetrahydropterin/6-carboxytetrahydropterin synthase